MRSAPQRYHLNDTAFVVVWPISSTWKIYNPKLEHSPGGVRNGATIKTCSRRASNKGTWGLHNKNYMLVYKQCAVMPIKGISKGFLPSHIPYIHLHPSLSLYQIYTYTHLYLYTRYTPTHISISMPVRVIQSHPSKTPSPRNLIPFTTQHM